MTEGSPPQAEGTTVQPAAPAEPAEDMDLSDAPKAPPWAAADEEPQQGGDEDRR